MYRRRSVLSEEATFDEFISEEFENMYLNFYVNQEVFSIKLRYVIQIVNMQEISAMPEMPAYMKGFINLRGSVIPVVSMRERFGKMGEANERTCIIIVSVNEREIGLIVDSIKETVSIKPDRILPPPNIVQGTDNVYVTGIAKLNGNNVSILIDMQKLFGGQGF